GITINGSPGNLIGGTAAGAGNVISGNTGNGVVMASAGGNLVQGNYIGTNTAGSAAVPNAAWGLIVSDAPSNTIGGTVSGAGNVVSGNAEGGIALYGTNAQNNFVQGNVIGLE